MTMSNDVAIAKNAIRAQVRQRREALDPAWIMENSNSIQIATLALEEMKAARVVCCYMGMPNEVQTDLVCEHCWNDEKKLCVPVYREREGCYETAWLERESELRVDRWGIREPMEIVPVTSEDIDVIIVPGLAFDSDGNRLGHGKGYYDRLIDRQARQALKLGLAFDFQIFASVPTSDHDIKMDAVVTESRLLR